MWGGIRNTRRKTLTNITLYRVHLATSDIRTYIYFVVQGMHNVASSFFGRNPILVIFNCLFMSVMSLEIEIWKGVELGSAFIDLTPPHLCTFHNPSYFHRHVSSLCLIICNKKWVFILTLCIPCTTKYI
jgi:hypothetical protein